MVMESKTLFSAENRVAPLGIISLAGAQELSRKVEAHLVRWAKLAGLDYDTFLIESSCPRFSSGDGKGMINSTVRGYDLFFIVDVGNYSLTYNYFGQENRMSPDDHYQDLKRLIQAASGKAHRMNVVMPLLYGGRQHRRSYRESLDCAYMLQELQHMGVSNLLTFDAHDPRVQNAVPVMGFDNLMPEYQVLKKLFKDFPDLSTDKNDFMIVSPDEGALNRNMHYASVLGVELGMLTIPALWTAATRSSRTSTSAPRLRARTFSSPTTSSPRANPCSTSRRTSRSAARTASSRMRRTPSSRTALKSSTRRTSRA